MNLLICVTNMTLVVVFHQGNKNKRKKFLPHLLPTLFRLTLMVKQKHIFEKER